MHYALTVNSYGIITGVHESEKPIAPTQFAKNPRLCADGVLLIPEGGEYRTGLHILCYNEDGTQRPDVWCIENGYMEMPDGYEIVDGELVKTNPPASDAPQTWKDFLAQETERIEAETAQKFTGMKPLLNELMTGKTAAVVLPLVGMMDDWKEGNWTVGKSLVYNGYPYKVVQAHNSAGNPGWNPESAPALFAPWHGISLETALPWRKPTGAQDMYKKAEYIVWTDGSVYKCLSDTAYSPAEYPQAWELQSKGG